MISSNLMIYPLGGVEEIGSNCTIYFYNGNFVIIDYGISMYSVDDLTPYSSSYLDLSKFIEKFYNEIVTLTLIITHCHDDHIGGMHLLNKDNIDEKFLKLNMVIYVCHAFNKEIINTKYGDMGPRIEIIDYEHEVKISEDICFKYYAVDHSIPHASGVYLIFNKLRIFHTGDWRFDENVAAIPTTAEVLENANKINSKSLKTFVSLRNKCDILVSESTNVARIKPYCNENMVAKELEFIFQNAAETDKELFFTCFASNVERLRVVIKTAMKLSLSLSYMGRAISVFLKASHRVGVISNAEFAYVKGHTNLESLMKDSSRIKMVTGCQNEQNSVLNRLAYANKKCLSGKQIIIFSANIIPVARKRVENLYKQLERMNVHVITTDVNSYIHSSGHATRKEIMRMYNIISAKAVLPVHGNVVTIREHSKMVIKNFKMPSLKPKYLRYFLFDATQNTKIKCQVLNMQDKYISEKRSLDYRLYEKDHEVFSERKKLIRNGVIIVNVMRRIVMPIGTRIGQNTVHKIIEVCESNSGGISDAKNLNFKRIKMQISRIIFGFNGEIIIN